MGAWGTGLYSGDFASDLRIAVAAVARLPFDGERLLGLLCDIELLIPEEAAPQFLDDAAPRNGMMPPPDSEMIAPPITE